MNKIGCLVILTVIIIGILCVLCSCCDGCIPRAPQLQPMPNDCTGIYVIDDIIEIPVEKTTK